METGPIRSSWSVENLNSPFHTAILVCLVASLSYLAARLGGALILRPQNVWPLWPGCALLVAVLLLAPRRIWPILIAAAFAAFAIYDLQSGVQIGSVVRLLLADTVEVLIAALLVSYSFNGVPRLDSVKALAKYSLSAVILAPFAVSFLGALAWPGDYWISWRVSLFSEAIAFLTLTPAILGWSIIGPTWRQKPRAYYLEAAALIATLSLLGYLNFVAPERSSSPALLYSLVPLLLWSALRFGSAGVGTSMIVIACLSIRGTVHGRGPFSGSGPLDNVLSLQMFLLMAAAPFMVLAALVEERKRAEKEVRESEERLHLAMHGGKLGGWEWEPKTGRIPWFRGTNAQFGMNASDSFESPQDFWDRVHPEDRDNLRKAIEIAKQERVEFDQEFRVVWPDQTVHWLRSMGRFVFTTGNQPERMLGILRDVTERKHTEQALRQREAELREAQRLAKLGSWQWDPETDTVTWSEELYRIAGRDPNLTAVSYKEHQQLYTPESWERLRLAVEEALRTGTPYELDLEMVRSDGTSRWLVARGEAKRNTLGRIVQLVGTVQDITDRKRAEKTLRDSEERFRLAAQAGRMYAYEWDVATDAVVRSAESRNILGLTGDPMRLTHQQLLSSVHLDDRSMFIAADKLTPENPTVQIVYRLLRPDNVVIWLEKTARAFFDEQNRMVRMIGMVVDVTERKLAEAALANASRKLIEAQEQERNRIGRELHDDIGQRLAMVAVQLEQVHEDSLVLPEVRTCIGELRKEISEIAADIQSLSHELHSAKLQYLGIAAAMRGFCQEFGEQQKAEIDFQNHDLPSPLSPDISLCFFRVLQEALHNSAKHSGVRHFEVRLWGTSDEIHLSVKDSGAGFDRQAARKSRGLGLISMEERLKLVKGTLSINSEPKGGTTIHACVPFDSSRDSARAAGSE
jgi:PAS domain S-box-containing protein